MVSVDLEELADEVRMKLKRDHHASRASERDLELFGLTWDEKVALIVDHIRYRGSQYSPREWYR